MDVNPIAFAVPSVRNTLQARVSWGEHVVTVGDVVHARPAS